MSSVYTSKFPIFTVACSSRKDFGERLAIGSMLEGKTNNVEIIAASNSNKNKFSCISSFEHKLPPSKLMWFPEHDSSNPDLLVTSSDTLKIWEVTESSEVELRSSLWNVPNIKFIYLDRARRIFCSFDIF